MIEIINCTEENKSFIKSLNIEWLSKYFSVEPNDEVQLSNPQEEIIDKGGMIFYAKFNNQIVGTATLMKVNDTTFELSKMAVTEAMQGKGIGIALMEHCLQLAKSNNIKKLILYSNTKLETAIAIYRKYGFTEVPFDATHYKRANIKNGIRIMKSNILSIRQQIQEDIPLIVDYFLNASDEHLSTMGVDRLKLYEREYWINLLNKNYKLDNKNKKLFYSLWLLNDKPIGHCNINKITVNEEAYMHLHLWQNDIRQKGLGLEFLKLSIPIFFEEFNLKKIFCEPYALNPAPNKVLEKYGFELMKMYITTPGVFNFEQEVNRWCLTQEKQDKIYESR